MVFQLILLFSSMLPFSAVIDCISFEIVVVTNCLAYRLFNVVFS